MKVPKNIYFSGTKSYKDDNGEVLEASNARLNVFAMYLIYGVSGLSLYIESTYSMII